MTTKKQLKRAIFYFTTIPTRLSNIDHYLITVQVKICSVIVCCLFLYSCSDYQSGYSDALNDEPKQWVVFGKSEYTSGYHSGEADRFQNDWMLESNVQSSELSCPTFAMEGGPLLLLPENFKRISPDTYQLIEL